MQSHSRRDDVNVFSTGRRLLKALILLHFRIFSRILDGLRPESRVVVYYAWPDFARKAQALARALESGGIPTVVRTGLGFLVRARVRVSTELHIGFWNHFYPEDLPERYIFYNAEPLGLSRWRDNRPWRDMMHGALQIWGYARRDHFHVDYFGMPYRYIPFGYSPYYEQVYAESLAGQDIDVDIDVLFVGNVGDRRRVLLDRIRETGVTLEVVTYKQPLRGAALDRIIARSRIILSVYAFDDPETHVPDLARLDHLLSNGRFVLHESLPERSMDSEFVQYVPTASYAEIPEQCLYFLQNATERERIAREGREWFRTRRPISASLPYDEIRELMR